MNKDPLPTKPRPHVSKAAAGPNISTDRTHDHPTPGFYDRCSFFVRSWGLKVLRFVRDLSGAAHRLKRERLHHPFVLAESITRLRTELDATEGDFRRGKLENLRRACRQLNGTVIPSGGTFSFWKQVGPPWRARGFVRGRELREGCVIPTVGGGLCQISGSLYQAASQAGLKIVERHRHTANVPGTEIRVDRDATVYWNYVDLRFEAGDEPVAIEARMTPDELIVRIRAEHPRQTKTRDARTEDGDLGEAAEGSALARSAESCVSCEQTDCAQHVDRKAEIEEGHLKTAAMLDAVVPEFESYLSGELIDLYFLPIRPLLGGRRYRWYTSSTSIVRTAPLVALARALYTRWASRKGHIAAEIRLRTSRWLARAYARRLPYDVEHLIVTQDFLPFLWSEGVLQGRSFDVLLTRPALSVAHERLDRAAESMPAAKQLVEFRAPRELVEAESEALVYAERVITPHEDLAKAYPNLRKLEWQKPAVDAPADVPRPRYLLFPASLAAREGAHAALAVSEELDMPLLVVGRDLEGLADDSELVEGIDASRGASEIPWAEIAAVVHPTLFESWPRLHLYAQALGIPVVTTEHSGLEEGKGVTIVPFNDETALLKALERVLSRQQIEQEALEPHLLPRDFQSEVIDEAGAPEI